MKELTRSTLKVIVIFTIFFTLIACGGEDKETAKEVEELAERLQEMEEKILKLEKAEEADSTSVTNGTNLFLCKENGQPIRVDKYQNGICDCPDGSDELPGTCK
jgi:hypothetical protein